MRGRRDIPPIDSEQRTHYHTGIVDELLQGTPGEGAFCSKWKSSTDRSPWKMNTDSTKNSVTS